MKKITFCILSMFAIVGSTQAQGFSIGPKVGANFSSIKGVENIKSKTGYYVGAFAEINFTDNFSIQPEVLYTAQGGKFSSVSIPEGSLESDVTNSYVSVPVMFKYRLIAGLAVEVGPKFDFLTKSQTKLHKLKIDSKDAYQSFNLGLGVGLSYRLPLGLSIDARYNIGLSKLNKDISIAGTPSSGDNLKNDVFQIGVGFRFL
nr:porin family protein [uncultured Flavobacterium sp.]